MIGEYDAWLTLMKAEKRGGYDAILPAIDRGLSYSGGLILKEDLSAGTFYSALRTAPGASGLAATFSVDKGAFQDGQMTVSLQLTASQTTTLPADGDKDGLTWLFYDLLYKPSGQGARRIIGSAVPVSEAITPLP